MAVADLKSARSHSEQRQQWRADRWNALRLPQRIWARVRCRVESAASHVRAPVNVRSSVPVEHGERILAFAQSLEGGLVAATDQALHHQAAGTWSRIGWEQLAFVRWDGAQRTWAVKDVISGRVTSVGLHPAEGTRLADLARERVAWTVLLTKTVSVPGHGTARISARRSPGSGRIGWQVALGEGSSAVDPRLRSQIDAAIVELRAHIGI